MQICWMEKSGRSRVEEKARTVVREAAVQQRSKAGREDDKSFHGSRASRVGSLPIRLFLGSSLHVKVKGREDASGLQLVGKIVPMPFLGLN